MQHILKFFPNLTAIQIAQFEQLLPLYQEWNEQINVISRKDIDELYQRHVLHSLAIVKVIEFLPGTDVLDLGTGGGFPGIPLAILFPEVNFHLVDSIGKKIKVVQAVADALGLKNVIATHSRAEDIKGKYDFVVSRAVAELGKLLQWTRKHLKTKHINMLPNGWLILKGGNIKAEIKALPRREYTEQTSIQKLFKDEYFEDKYVLYVQG
jgi:16S rRNA (guanine527-N7)-methyltransferase